MLSSGLARFGATLNVAALVALVVAIAKRDEVKVEATYFGRTELSGYPTAWMVAAAILLVLGTTALVLAQRR